jgi:molybdate transport system regulatory protein
VTDAPRPAAPMVGETSSRTRAPSSGPFRLRLQIMSDGDGAMGPGKAALLEAIRETGSISAAGRLLDISYRRCWLMVEEMNRCWDHPLIEAQRGGRGQGARVSTEGLSVLAAYRALEARLLAEIESAPETALLRTALRSPPAVRPRED